MIFHDFVAQTRKGAKACHNFGQWKVFKGKPKLKRTITYRPFFVLVLNSIFVTVAQTQSIDRIAQR